MQLKTAARVANILFIIFLQLHVTDSRKRSPSINKEEEDFYSYFIREAPLHEVDYSLPVAPKDIPWLDLKLIKRASRFVQENMIGVAMAHMYSLIEVFSLKTTASVLLKTRNFANSTIAYKRLLKTVLHIREWELAGLDILNPKSNAFKSLQTIRRRHRSAAYVSKHRSIVDLDEEDLVVSTKEDWQLMRALKADLAHVDTSESPKFIQEWDSSTPVGQFDLAVVQFWFFCHAVMTPQAYGVIPSSFTDFKAFIHLWAVIGRMLGIQDRFNVALNLPVTMYRKFYKDIIVASLKTVDVRQITLMNHTMEGLSRNFLVPTMFQLKCWLHHVLRHTVTDFSARHIAALMDLEDHLCLNFFAFGSGPINRFRLFGQVSTLTFNSWMRQETEALGIKEF